MYLEYFFSYKLYIIREHEGASVIRCGWRLGEVLRTCRLRMDTLCLAHPRQRMLRVLLLSVVDVHCEIDGRDFDA